MFHRGRSSSSSGVDDKPEFSLREETALVSWHLFFANDGQLRSASPVVIYRLSANIFRLACGIEVNDSLLYMAEQRGCRSSRRPRGVCELLVSYATT